MRSARSSALSVVPPFERFLPLDLERPFFSRGFLSRHARWTKRKMDYSLSLNDTLTVKECWLSTYF